MSPYDVAVTKRYDRCAELLRPDEPKTNGPAAADTSKPTEQSKDETDQTKRQTDKKKDQAPDSKKGEGSKKDDSQQAKKEGNDEKSSTKKKSPVKRKSNEVDHTSASNNN